MRIDSDISVIQRCYDLVAWFIPCLERLPRSHKYTLGERTQSSLYSLLEQLILARYDSGAVAALEQANARLDVLRYQVRLLVQFQLLDQRRYEHAAGLMDAVGTEIGAWLKYRRRRETDRQPLATDYLVGEPGVGGAPGSRG